MCSHGEDCRFCAADRFRVMQMVLVSDEYWETWEWEEVK